MRTGDGILCVHIGDINKLGGMPRNTVQSSVGYGGLVRRKLSAVRFQRLRKGGNDHSTNHAVPALERLVAPKETGFQGDRVREGQVGFG